MSMSILQHSTTSIHHSFKRFSKLVHLSEILRASNVKKSKGIKVTTLLEWLLNAILNRYSIFRADESQLFTKRTVRNCLNNPRTNWQKLVQLLAINLITYVEHFTDPRRRQALIVDDSLFKREFSKNTELLARVFDHDKQTYFKGFRALTLGWSDGNTFLPVNFALMSSSKKSNQLGIFKHFDKRSLAYQRRAQAQRKMNDVALELIDSSLKNGIKAKYVLFDSWYSSPRMFSQLLKRGLFGIGMLKKTKKVYFRYRNRQMDVKTLYENLCRTRWSTKEKYLYSSMVTFEVNGQEMPVKLVFVTNRGNKNNYLVLATTKTSLRPDQIIQMYGRRWQIESYFKVAKQYLQFDKTQIQSYDGLCGHLSVVALGYDILALSQRENIDERTLGDIFYDYGRSLPDIDISDALGWLIQTINGLVKNSCMNSSILDSIFDEFIKTLPNRLIRLLSNAS